jgi:hypothetical protein
MNMRERLRPAATLAPELTRAARDYAMHNEEEQQGARRIPWQALMFLDGFSDLRRQHH